jgi:L-threonylcarbamoyladenylate synthase
VARALLMAADRPIAAPSANRSGHVSASTARHVQDDLDGRIAAIVDGGASPIGVESTILGCLDDRITMLRPGGLARAALETALGFPIHEGAADADAPRAPGRLTSHYAPHHALRLNGKEVRPGEALLDFGGKGLPGSPPVATRDLSPSGTLTEAAANLYTYLRDLDSIPSTGIVVSPLPPDGLGEAIEDRLIRAAAPRR